VWRIRSQELERPPSGGEFHKRRCELRAELLEATRVRQRRTVAKRLEALLVVDQVLPFSVSSCACIHTCVRGSGMRARTIHGTCILPARSSSASPPSPRPSACLSKEGSLAPDTANALEGASVGPSTHD